MTLREKYKDDKDVLRLIKSLELDNKTDEEIEEILEIMGKMISDIKENI